VILRQSAYILLWCVHTAGQDKHGWKEETTRRFEKYIYTHIPKISYMILLCHILCYVI
jgi:hypothetical protein